MESNSRGYLEKGLQGSRPTALQISKGSRTICKSSNIRPMLQSRKPVIIYLRSPEVIHTNPQDFMALVQRLTGSSPTRSRCEESIIKREAAIEELRPPTSTDHSQSILNCSFDEYVSDISAFLQDDDQMGMDSAIVSLPANLGEELMEEFPPNMACLRVEGRGMSLPNLYPELQSGEIASWSANNAMPSQDESCAVQDYALDMYECCLGLVWPHVPSPPTVFGRQTVGEDQEICGAKEKSEGQKAAGPFEVMVVEHDYHCQIIMS